MIIPGTIPVRMGTYHGTNFMIAYWYPKMAVYDDIRGWNSIPHTGNCEYYNDFGDFDVEITVPKNYNVWSSGILKNATEIYSKKYLEKIDKAANSDEIIKVITKEDRLENKITIDAEKHTYKFKAKNLPDFAFAVSNSYLWDATSVKVGNNRVLVHAVYYENSKDFHEVADISRKIIDYFSTKCPAIEFPYPQMVAFNGSGGMEFPGMINDGDGENKNGTIYVTAHEIGHTYFPFYTGLNEQRYAWMDEGLISFFPQKVVAKYTDDKDYVAFRSTVKGYNHYAGTEIEIPLMVSSTNTGQAYRYQAYSRSSTAFYVLHEMIGEEKFNEALQEFASRWKSKHPTPYDFFFTFDKIVGEDLGWFWKPWFFELGYADLALENVSKKNEENTVEVINKGGFPVPVKLKVVYKDGSENIIEKPISIWKNQAKSIKIQLPEGKISFLELDSEMIPDVFPENNRVEL
ncbi:MAG: M1 family metallopeptidase [Chloroflexia bacterium]|nr:M1 family metallopeptidase [Chloroflexia bacterium]